MDMNDLSGRVIGCAIEVHRTLGPGLPESTYERCLCHELDSAGLRYEAQKVLPVLYKGVRIECGYRVDVLVESVLIVELKAADLVHPIHDAQLMTHMRLMHAPLGLLVNFNVPRLVDGIRRFVL